VGHSLDFVYNPKTSIEKSIKRASKPSKPTILAKQAKQASSRCQKLQASKLSLLSLARLLIPNSTYLYLRLTTYFPYLTPTDAELVIIACGNCLYPPFSNRSYPT